MKSLIDKVAIVTGASSGIGYETAKLFAEEGAKLVLVARRRAELDALVAELAAMDAEAVACAGDVADEACAKAAVELAVARFGGLDILYLASDAASFTTGTAMLVDGGVSISRP